MAETKHEATYTRIKVENEQVFVLRDDETLEELEEGAVRRSELLVQLLESKPGTASLPVDPSSLNSWRKYVHLQLQKDDSADEGLPNINDLVILVKV